MKIAPIARAIRKERSLKHVLVHTGQHYDHKMSKSFFEDLQIPRPDVNLEVGSGSHALQTSLIMARFEKVLMKEKPDVVLVVGDVNSTLACSLVAVKKHVAVAHVEAGLRSFDRNMPEEINRLVTDSVTDIFFTTCKDANVNLVKEGVAKNRIFFVGNVMIDNLMFNIKASKQSKLLETLSPQEAFALVTLHRPSNVDNKSSLKEIFFALKEIQKKIKVLFPVHPRTRKNLKKFIPKSALNQSKNLILLDPLRYFDFLHLMRHAKMVITDSGGIQEETTVLKVPCLTVRENTERPITIAEGSNILVGVNGKRIVREGYKIINGRGKRGKTPPLWDGKTSLRIIKVLKTLNKKGNLRI